MTEHAKLDEGAIAVWAIIVILALVGTAYLWAPDHTRHSLSLDGQFAVACRDLKVSGDGAVGYTVSYGDVYGHTSTIYGVRRVDVGDSVSAEVEAMCLTTEPTR